MWYQNIRSALFSFVTIHASSDGRTDGQTDRQTDGQNCDSNTVRCITCSRTVKIALWATLWGSLGGNVRTPSIASWKVRGRLNIFVIINFFRYLLRLRHYKRKSVEVGVSLRGVGHFEHRFQGNEASPTNHCLFRVAEWLRFVWYQNICSAPFRFVTIHACDTERWTDRITSPKKALAYARAVKTRNRKQIDC